MSKIIATQPKPPGVTNLTLESGVKSATLAWDLPFDNVGISWEVWTNDVDDIQTAVKDGDAATTTYTTAVFGKAYFWVRSKSLYGMFSDFVGSLSNTPGLITSVDTVQSPPSSLGFGVGSGSAAGSITTYNTWNVATFASFYVDEGSNAIISIGMLARAFTSGVSGASFSNPYATVLRTRLYDATVGADVPASIKTYVLYEHNGFQPAGTERYLMNINETFVSGFRGLIVPGHSYTFYAEVMKQRTGTSATASVEISGMVTTSGSSSI